MASDPLTTFVQKLRPSPLDDVILVDEDTLTTCRTNRNGMGLPLAPLCHVAVVATPPASRTPHGGVVIAASGRLSPTELIRGPVARPVTPGTPVEAEGDGAMKSPLLSALLLRADDVNVASIEPLGRGPADANRCRSPLARASTSAALSPPRPRRSLSSTSGSTVRARHVNLSPVSSDPLFRVHPFHVALRVSSLAATYDNLSLSDLISHFPNCLLTFSDSPGVVNIRRPGYTGDDIAVVVDECLHDMASMYIHRIILE